MRRMLFNNFSNFARSRCTTSVYLTTAMLILTFIVAIFWITVAGSQFWMQNAHAAPGDILHSRAAVPTVPATGRGMWFPSSQPLITTVSSDGRQLIPTVDNNNIPHLVGHDSGAPAFIGHSWYVGSGGNCSLNNAWNCEQIETNPWFFADAKFTNGKLRALYSMSSSGPVRYAEYVGNGTGTGCNTGNTNWTCISIDGTTKRPYSLAVKPDSTIAIVTSNRASGSSGSIDYCEGTIVSGAWSGTCRIDFLPNGQMPSLSLTSSGQPRIAYYNVTISTQGLLSYAECDTSCTTTGTWTITGIDYVTYIGLASNWNVYHVPSLKVDAAGNPHIGYTIDPNGGTAVFYARKASGSEVGGCSYNGTDSGPGTTTPGWRCEYVNGDGVNGRAVDLVLEPLAGRVRMVTYAAVDGTGVHDYIQQIESGGVFTTYPTPPTRLSTACYDVRGLLFSTGTVGWKLVNPTKWACEVSNVQHTSNSRTINLAFDKNGQPIVATGLGVSQLLYPLQNTLTPTGLNNIAVEDNVYESMANVVPVYQSVLKMFRHEFIGNTSGLIATWKGRSSLASTTNSVSLQVFRFGSIQQWETVATDSVTAANVKFTLSTAGWSPAGSPSDYYFAVPGGYQVYWRVVQQPSNFSTSFTLSTDLWSLTAASTLRVEGRQGSQSGALVTSQSINFDVTGAQVFDNRTTTSGIWSSIVSAGAYTATPDPTVQGSYSYNAVS